MRLFKGMDISQDRRFDQARDMQKTLRRAYNTMQQSMSAETVAFGFGDSGSEELANADAKTEVGINLGTCGI